jgi:hypothetical protein
MGNKGDQSRLSPIGVCMTFMGTGNTKDWTNVVTAEAGLIVSSRD